ncbi:hypothetical protein DMH04_40090 [Kibdelosporangium aridum]|uniref:Uncharacterized protein n=1 Tax=Kibdelosporangium aridum TaxID=2030 RepID=A0A428YWD7_KIBAR|nr:hypothetical protein [Kibdelosporangium aridum]RSM74346.1 hypothetical protein DMH04_40090 [Kibdelosporangium aridum]
MTEMTSPNPPARKRMIVPLVVLVLFVLAAGTFGTLWLLERGDHSKVSEELTVVRTETDGVRAKLSEAEKKQADLDKQVTEAGNARRTAETTAWANEDCAKATKEMNAAALARDLKLFEEKFDNAWFHCGGES